MTGTQKNLDELLAPPAAGAAQLGPTRFMETVMLRFLARVIHADGHIDDAEVKMLSEIAVQLGMRDDEARRVLDDELHRQSDVVRLASQIPDRIRQREVYAMGCLVGYADGDVHDREKQVLADFARGAQIPEADALEILEVVVEAARGAKKS